MPQGYFQFREFRIEQSRAAMRVSTDACIQAALYADYLKNQHLKGGDLLLDIGAGTGLLSLMIAQTIPLIDIIALEPNEGAAADCRENFGASSWSKRLNIEATPLQNYESTQLAKAIICNPPFFQNHLKSENVARSAARHDDNLGKDELVVGILDNLTTDSSCCVMYPTTEWDAFLVRCETAGLHLQELHNIKPNPKKPINRKVGIFAPSPPVKPPAQSLQIRTSANDYTPEFTALLQPYFIDEYFKK